MLLDLPIVGSISIEYAYKLPKVLPEIISGNPLLSKSAITGDLVNCPPTWIGQPDKSFPP